MGSIGLFGFGALGCVIRGRFWSIAFLTGHSVARYVRSLAPLSPLTRSAALCFATLASLTCSIHRLAHSLCSLPRETVVSHKSVFTLKMRSKGRNAFFYLHYKHALSLSWFVQGAMDGLQRATLKNISLEFFEAPSQSTKESSLNATKGNSSPLLTFLFSWGYAIL